MDGADLLFLEIINVSLLLLHLQHLVLDTLLETCVHRRYNKHHHKDAQHTNYDVQFCVLFANTTDQIWILQVKALSPRFELIKRTHLLVTTDGNLPRHSIVQNLSQ